MYEGVIPLSAIHRHIPRTPQDVLIGLMIHVVCVGWPIRSGFVTHYFIATSWAALYWIASRRVRLLVRQPWWCGALYGGLVYAVMYEGVIPLSAIHRHIPRTPQDVLIGLMIHVVCVGWPI